MPYSGPDDATLPANVKKMPTEKRSQWVAVFNSAMKRGGAEGAAFAQANGVSAGGKEVEDLHLAESVAVAEKCMDMPAPAWAYGGARTFAEADAYEVAHDKTEELFDIQREFRAIVDNIWAAGELDVSAKARAVAAAAAELESRLMVAAKKKDGGLVGSIVRRLLGTPPEPVATEVQDVEPDPATDEKAASMPVPMSVFKDINGAWRYVAIATNSYRDKEGETFSPESHKDYVDWVDREKMFPELWLWHTPNTRIGRADSVYFDEDTGFRVSTGTFDKGMDDVAERLAAMPGLAMSHGYLFRKDHLIDGVYHRYRDFEETVLPSIDVAASDQTAFIATREEAMTVPAEKREFFEKVLGKDRFAKIEASLGERAASMTDEEFATAFKSVMAETAVAEPPVAVADPPSAAAAPPADPPVEPPPTVEDDKAIVAMKAAVIEGMKESLAPLQTSLKELADWRTGIDAAIKDLRKSDDEKVAGMFGIRGYVPGTITPPSDDPTNIVDGRAMRALKDALGGNTKEETPAASPVAPMVDMLMQSLRMPELATV